MSLVQASAPIDRPGFFLAIDGIDGSGKSTICERLRAILAESGHDVILVRAPGGTPTADAIRAVIKNHSFNNITDIMLFMAAQIELYNTVIKEALDENKIVISDRYVSSTYAYQIAPHPELIPMFNLMMGALSAPGNDIFGLPDAICILDVDIDTAMKRIAADNRPDGIVRFEDKDRLTVAQQAFRSMSKGDRSRIDTTELSIDTVAYRIHSGLTFYEKYRRCIYEQQRGVKLMPDPVNNPSI
jgi:dTMP kinase